MMNFTRFSILASVWLTLATTSSAAVSTWDLTVAAASKTITADLGGTFRVDQISPGSTGTGVIDSFLRIQANNNESGFNTSLSTPLDSKASGFTRALGFNEVPIVNLGGTLYRQFLLDINQNSGQSNEYLTLNQIQIFLRNGDTDSFSTVKAADSNNAPQISISGATEIFRMSSSGESAFNQIVMNYALNSGSGSGDMFLYVRDSLFVAGFSNIILYSQFGNDPNNYLLTNPPNLNANDGGSNDGFEEWAVLKPAGTPPLSGLVPEPASMAAWMIGLGVCGIAGYRRRRKAAAV